MLTAKQKAKYRRNILPASVRTKKGKRSDCIQLFAEWVRKQKSQGILHPEVILCSRVSTEKQKPHLETYDKVLAQEAKKLGCKIVGQFAFSETAMRQWDRPEFYRALLKAKKLDAAILSYSGDRFIRDICFDYRKPIKTDVPSWYRLEEFKELIAGVTVCTLLDPDLCPRKVRRHQSDLGVERTHKKIGRPKKKPAGYIKERFLKYYPKVMKMRKQGKSYSEIQKTIPIKRSTLSRWVNSGGSIFRG